MAGQMVLFRPDFCQFLPAIFFSGFFFFIQLLGEIIQSVWMMFHNIFNVVIEIIIQTI